MFETELKQAFVLYDRGGPTSGKNMEVIAEGGWAMFEDVQRQSEPAIPWERDDLSRLGEICRSTMIRLIEHSNGNHPPAVWRARSLALFTEAGSANGTAMVILGLALGAFSEGDVTSALAQFDVMELIIHDDDGVITGDLVRSAVLENRAIVQGAMGQWNEARESLRRVIEIEQRREPVGLRRVLKARAALTTIDYAEGEVDAAIASLQEIVRAARENGDAGIVADKGDANLVRMEARVPWTELLQYQVI